MTAHTRSTAQTTTTANAQPWHRAYEAKWGHDECHPRGGGDSRFAPFTFALGTNVPSLYLAETNAAALVETVFHDVHPLSKRLVTVSLPSPPVLLDLSDLKLQRLSVSRGEVVSSPAEHSPCTRAIARAGDSAPRSGGRHRVAAEVRITGVGHIRGLTDRWLSSTSIKIPELMLQKSRVQTASMVCL